MKIINNGMQIIKRKSSDLKMANFHKYNLEELSMKEYNELQDALKRALDDFHREVKDIKDKNSDLKTFNAAEEDKATKEVYDLVSEIDTLVVSYYGDKDYGEHAKELRAKLDLILGRAHRLDIKLQMNVLKRND